MSAEDIQNFPKWNSDNYSNSFQVLIICMLTQYRNIQLQISTKTKV